MPLAMLTMKKIVAWFSISMHACDPVPIVVVLRLTALRAAELRLQAKQEK